MRVVLVLCPPPLFPRGSSSSRPRRCCPRCPRPYCSPFLPRKQLLAAAVGGAVVVAVVVFFVRHPVDIVVARSGNWGCCGGGRRRGLLPVVRCSPTRPCQCGRRCRGQEIHHPASSGLRRWVSLAGEGDGK
jgi:hypothetical protein